MTLTCPHCTKDIRLQVNPQIVKNLTPKEIEVLQAKTQRGEGNKEIAARLHTTEQVIKNRMRGIYQALNVHSDIELMVLWFRNVQPCPNPKSGQAA
jgi:DNA-binding NarL/FixJ family response regulator